METMTVSEYRNNLSASFAKADHGERVLIRRNKEIYALIKVGHEDQIISPELQARIEEAERECKEGRCTSCSTPEELNRFLESL